MAAQTPQDNPMRSFQFRDAMRYARKRSTTILFPIDEYYTPKGHGLFGTAVAEKFKSIMKPNNV